MSLAGPARLTVAAACAAPLICLSIPALASAEQPFVPGEALVRFEPRLSGEEVRSALGTRDASVEAKLPAVPGLRLVDLPAGTSVREAVSAFGELPGVLYAEPNYRRELFGASTDPLFARQWALRNTGQLVFGKHGLAGADERVTGAWDQGQGSAAVKIAIADTGLAFSHPDLDANLWSNPGEIPGNGIDEDLNGFADDVHGWDFAGKDADPSDSADPEQGHGTHVAGIIGAEGANGIGVAGLNWNVALMPLRTPLSVVGEVSAINYAKDEGARIFNYSAGSSIYSPSEKAAIDAAPDVLFVVAAGNDRNNNDANPVYPCSYNSPNVICVGSSSQADGLSGFSDFGPTAVDLVAPGENILSTWPAGGVADVLRDSFSQLPLKERWKAGGKGRRWNLTRRLHKGLSLADSPKGRYKKHTNSWIRSRRIDLSVQRSCDLAYYFKAKLDSDKDRLVVEASRNGKHYRQLRTHPGKGSKKRDGDRTVVLPRRFNGDGSVFIRFRLIADGRGRGDGAYVDDVELSCQATANTWAYEDGTSFSAPQVSGAAGLVLARHPGYGTSDLRSALLGSVDQLAPLYGKVATAGRLNVDAAVGP